MRLVAPGDPGGLLALGPLASLVCSTPAQTYSLQGIVLERPKEQGESRVQLGALRQEGWVQTQGPFLSSPPSFWGHIQASWTRSWPHPWWQMLSHLGAASLLLLPSPAAASAPPELRSLAGLSVPDPQAPCPLAAGLSVLCPGSAACPAWGRAAHCRQKFRPSR